VGFLAYSGLAHTSQADCLALSASMMKVSFSTVKKIADFGLAECACKFQSKIQNPQSPRVEVASHAKKIQNQ
jgi:hypothetical protein